MGWVYSKNWIEPKQCIDDAIGNKEWIKDGYKFNLILIDHTPCSDLPFQEIYAINKINKTDSNGNITEGIPFITVLLISYDKGLKGYGYKSMDEVVHPCYYNCPLSFLEKVPTTSQSWRNKVLEHSKLKIG